MGRHHAGQVIHFVTLAHHHWEPPCSLAFCISLTIKSLTVPIMVYPFPGLECWTISCWGSVREYFSFVILSLICSRCLQNILPAHLSVHYSVCHFWKLHLGARRFWNWQCIIIADIASHTTGVLYDRQIPSPTSRYGLLVTWKHCCWPHCLLSLTKGQKISEEFLGAVTKAMFSLTLFTIPHFTSHAKNLRYRFIVWMWNLGTPVWIVNIITSR